ncbi:MAG: methyltransferase type 11 [Sphaerisporangium sp.]|nr:methyltransferase type 11 [Sphaerisporangium sp.]
MTNQPSTDQILDTPGPWATPHMQAEGYGSSRVLAQLVSENLPAPGVTYCVRTRGSDPIDAGATAEAILELAPTEAQVISLDNAAAMQRVGRRTLINPRPGPAASCPRQGRLAPADHRPCALPRVLRLRRRGAGRR